MEAAVKKGSKLLVKFKGLDTPEDARSLSGGALVVEREAAAPLAQGEYYIGELKGLAVNSKTGLCLGFVRDVIEGGNGFLIEVLLSGEQEGEKRLVPFRDEFFGDISIENGFLVLLNEWILE